MKRNSFATLAAVICGLAVLGTTGAATTGAAATAGASATTDLLSAVGTTSQAQAQIPAAEKSPTCPTANPPPGTGSQISSADAAEIVRAHNDARREALAKYNPGLPLVSVSWDPKIACDAQAWADDPASSADGGLHHSSRSTNGNEGENLFHAWPGPARPTQALDPSLSYSWVAEKPQFDADNNAPINSNAAAGTNFHAWGHYSQMIWMSPASLTTAIGCGVKEGVPVSGHTGWILVCRYSAAGNIDGQRAVPPGTAPAPVEPSRGVSAVSQWPGHLDVFWVGPDGSVRSQWWDGGSAEGAWANHGSFNIVPPNSAALNSGVAAVSQWKGHLDVFWIGPDGSVRSQWWDGGSAQGAWANHGSFNIAPPNSAARNSAIAAVSQWPGHLDVFWVGPDGSVRSQWWDGGSAEGAWANHGSFNIVPPNSAALNSGIAAVSQWKGHLDVFWVGPDGSVRSQWWDGGSAEGAWANHGSFNIVPPNSAAGNSAVATVSQWPGHLDVFWVGPDGSVRSQWWDGGSAEGAWANHGSFNIVPPNSAALNSGVAAVSQWKGHLDVFWVGPDGSVRSQWWDGGSAEGAWANHGSFNIVPPNSAARNSAIAAVSQWPGHLDVFWVGPDGSVRSQWWDGGSAQGAWANHGSFNIVPPNSAA